jgi:hypothetical protein
MKKAFDADSSRVQFGQAHAAGDVVKKILTLT